VIFILKATFSREKVSGVSLQYSLIPLSLGPVIFSKFSDLPYKIHNTVTKINIIPNEESIKQTGIDF
jgi:hypothetical protein